MSNSLRRKANIPEVPKGVLETFIRRYKNAILQSNSKEGFFNEDKDLPSLKTMALELCPDMKFSRDLTIICNLLSPEKRYPNARAIKRRIIYHSGPTNSGKTYNALKSLMESSSGVYCGPLRLLASEIFNRLNSQKVPCDLLTGEERKYGISAGTPSRHVSCTIEMMSTNNIYEVGIIDEIQMIKDRQRGWAWTNALLGMCANELHVCGDASAVNLVQKIATDCGDDFEVKSYDRLGPLLVERNPLATFNKLQKGDCIVGFNKKGLISTARKIGGTIPWDFSVIYGSLPAEVKLEQARLFNDPNNNVNILLATDAIGMGLNLNIKRIIFSSAFKSQDLMLSISEVKQISGRAGRFGSVYDTGLVTAFNSQSLETIKHLFNLPLPITSKAVIEFTGNIVEMLSYYLPYADLVEIIRVFDAYVTCNTGLYFLACSENPVRRLAELIKDIPLDPNVAYNLCCAPVPRDLVSDTVFREIAKSISQRKMITYGMLAQLLDYPPPKTIGASGLPKLEIMHDCVDMYVWLSYRFPFFLPDAAKVRKMYEGINERINSTLILLSKKTLTNKEQDKDS